MDIAADLRYMETAVRDDLRVRTESLTMMLSALIRSLRRPSK